MKLLFGSDPTRLVAADHLLVLAKKSCFGPRARGAGTFDRLLGKPLSALVMELGREADAGLLGGLATSLQGSDKRLTVAALADATSRHATPARAEAIRKVVAAA